MTFCIAFPEIRSGSSQISLTFFSFFFNLIAMIVRGPVAAIPPFLYISQPCIASRLFAPLPLCPPPCPSDISQGQTVSRTLPSPILTLSFPIPPLPTPLILTAPLECQRHPVDYRTVPITIIRSYHLLPQPPVSSPTASPHHHQ
jgi:hypothetical protein